MKNGTFSRHVEDFSIVQSMMCLQRREIDTNSNKLIIFQQEEESIKKNQEDIEDYRIFNVTVEKNRHPLDSDCNKFIIMYNCNIISQSKPIL